MAEPQLTGRAEAFALSTRELAPEDRTAAWQAALSRVLVDVEVSPVPGTDPWTGTLRAERFGALRIVTEETGAPVTIVRTSTAAAADKRSPVLLRQQLHGSALLLQDGRATRLGPGGLAFHDASRPFKLVITSDQRARILMLPRALLRLEEARLRLLTATVLDGAEDAPAALLLPLLSGLAEETLTAAPAQRERLARATADLVAVLALHQAGVRRRRSGDPGQRCWTGSRPMSRPAWAIRDSPRRTSPTATASPCATCTSSSSDRGPPSTPGCGPAAWSPPARNWPGPTQPGARSPPSRRAGASPAPRTSAGSSARPTACHRSSGDDRRGWRGALVARRPCTGGQASAPPIPSLEIDVSHNIQGAGHV